MYTLVFKRVLDQILNKWKTNQHNTKKKSKHQSINEETVITLMKTEAVQYLQITYIGTMVDRIYCNSYITPLEGEVTLCKRSQGIGVGFTVARQENNPTTFIRFLLKCCSTLIGVQNM